MSVEAPPRQLTDFLRSRRAVRKPLNELLHEERYRA
jgi:hypothetical protein